MRQKLKDQRTSPRAPGRRSSRPPSRSSSRGADRQRDADALADASPLAAALARSMVYRRLPMGLRSRLDSAILLRPKKLQTLEAIAAHFELSSYGISPAALRSYARRLEELVRPAATSQMLAAVFGCLPAGYRRRLLDGTQVVLLSRVIQALSAEPAQPLTIAEMVRLGTVLSAIARTTERPQGPGAKRSRSTRPAADQEMMQPAKIKELVRSIYGLSLSVPSVPEPMPTTSPSGA
ncbi:MAG TPA: hypothetical protein PK184_13015 [Phycisphaerae bacterium]|jgi:hypothetical protein|nr:hypothetical protein [Phycisphaerae bacterium]HOJ56732.1 hypothetical protein [Phycisphaerae bacterium]HOL27162.1 hypothetical protein [Phycisphaerae bacterium]HPP21569.1 hypothetical protein [Phycisphaerae bacterium]HPU33611.1 hypothetical protein [Phycisphaerae bacterium]